FRAIRAAVVRDTAAVAAPGAGGGSRRAWSWPKGSDPRLETDRGLFAHVTMVAERGNGISGFLYAKSGRMTDYEGEADRECANAHATARNNGTRSRAPAERRVARTRRRRVARTIRTRTRRVGLRRARRAARPPRARGRPAGSARSARRRGCLPGDVPAPGAQGRGARPPAGARAVALH